MANRALTLESFVVSLVFTLLESSLGGLKLKNVLSNEGSHLDAQRQTEIPGKNNTRRTINKEESKMCQRIKRTVIGRLLRRNDTTPESTHAVINMESSNPVQRRKASVTSICSTSSLEESVPQRAYTMRRAPAKIMRIAGIKSGGNQQKDRHDRSRERRGSAHVVALRGVGPIGISGEGVPLASTLTRCIMIHPSPVLLELAEEKKRSRSTQGLIPIHRQLVYATQAQAPDSYKTLEPYSDGSSWQVVKCATLLHTHNPIASKRPGRDAMHYAFDQ
ncbi:hypothetical protein IW262DRAFT_1294688 [Armillaria fumosa]|nr:hypothetical protein IW262DRAFT_1294688 [Armillaria fumosa]